MGKEYKRTNFSLDKNDLINDEYLLKSIANIIEINSKIKSIESYEGKDIINTFSIVRSHVNTKESITTAQIEGSIITTEKFIKQKEIIKSKISKNEVKFSKLTDEFVEPLNTNLVLKNFSKVIEKYGLGSRSLKKMHGMLFKNVTNDTMHSSLGEFKKSTNFLKESVTNEVIFIPAGIDILEKEMSKFDNFINESINNENKIDNIGQAIINSGIIHAWFERIHPFSDGNGRVGRMIIPFYLLEKKITSTPIIALSSEFKKNQFEYYRKLNSVQETSSYLEWLDFYLRIFLMTTKKLLSFIDEIDEYIKESELKLSNSDDLFVKSNSKLLAKIFIENVIIEKSILSKELRKSFEKKLISKIPSNQRIVKIMINASEILGFKYISKNPIIFINFDKLELEI